MIYSLTQFAGMPMEYEILKVRLAEELPFIDKFVIIEGDHTFSGIPKPFYLKEYPDILGDAKVEPIFFKYPKLYTDMRKNCALQRNALARTFKASDIIVWSDLDEIHRRQDIPRILAETEKLGYVHLQLKNHCYYINYVAKTYLGPTVSTCFAITGCAYIKGAMSFHQLRRECFSGNRRSGIPMHTVVTTGHHFDYLMTPEQIAQKLSQISAAQLYSNPQYADPHIIRNARNNGIDLFQRTLKRVWFPVPVDGTYPTSVLENIASWSRWIAPISN